MGGKYRTSGNPQKLTQNQNHFRKAIRKPWYSAAVSPQDPTYHPDINLTVPGVTITTPGTQTTYYAGLSTSPLPTSPQKTVTMYRTSYTTHTHVPSTPNKQPQVPTTPTPQPNPPPYYIQYPGRQYSTYEGNLIIAPPLNTTLPLKQTLLPSTLK